MSIQQNFYCEHGDTILKYIVKRTGLCNKRKQFCGKEQVWISGSVFSACM